MSFFEFQLASNNNQKKTLDKIVIQLKLTVDRKLF